jgi:hypothetical protein
VLEVNDISFSRATVRWQVLVARPLLTEGRLCFAGSGLPLPPMEKPDLLEFAQELWEAYRVQHPGSSLDDFYRDHGFDLYCRAREIATGPPPPVYTPEGHPVMVSAARYAVRAPVAVRERLDQAEEFVFAGRDADDPRAMHYVCLQGEGARVPEIPVEGKGLIMQTDWTAGPGEPTYRTLGDVRLWRNRLELSCLSRERLEVGKALLERILGRLIRHLADEFRDLDTLLASAEPVPPRYEEEVPADIREALAREMMTSHLAEWLDAPVPALDGKSPREASRDPGMREQLEELLKIVEYMEERKRRDGESYADVADLRRELGLPPR